jgi:hypothetical protein
MSNGKRSHCDDSGLLAFYSGKYVDYFIPFDSVIAGGEIMIWIDTNMVIGIKFWDAKKKVLLKCGCINGKYERTLEPD